MPFVLSIPGPTCVGKSTLVRRSRSDCSHYRSRAGHGLQPSRRAAVIWTTYSGSPDWVEQPSPAHLPVGSSALAWIAARVTSKRKSGILTDPPYVPTLPLPPTSRGSLSARPSRYSTRYGVFQDELHHWLIIELLNHASAPRRHVPRRLAAAPLTGPRGKPPSGAVKHNGPRHVVARSGRTNLSFRRYGRREPRVLFGVQTCVRDLLCNGDLHTEASPCPLHLPHAHRTLPGSTFRLSAPRWGTPRTIIRTN